MMVAHIFDLQIRVQERQASELLELVIKESLLVEDDIFGMKGWKMSEAKTHKHKPILSYHELDALDLFNKDQNKL